MLFTHFIFVVSYVVAMTSFYKAVLADPGFISKNLSREEQRAAVFDLADAGVGEFHGAEPGAFSFRAVECDV